LAGSARWSNFFLCLFEAPSFAQFWRRWNPLYGYVLTSPWRVAWRGGPVRHGSTPGGYGDDLPRLIAWSALTISYRPTGRLIQ